MAPPSEGIDYWRTTEACVHCGSDAFEPGWGPQTFVQCDCCCDKGAHLGCHQDATGRELQQEDLPTWTCSKECARISRSLVDLTARKLPLAGEGSQYTTELVRYTTNCRGSQASVDTALQIFHSAFERLEMGGGREMLTMVCQSYESPDPDEGEERGDEEEEEEGHNFSNFRVFLLRKGGAIVSAATVRVFGSKFCEVPFVATREGYRREGNCRRLMQVDRGLEAMLHQLGVQWIVIPAAKQVLPMWTRKFSYERFSKSECEVLEERIVMPDPDSAVLVRKRVQPPAPARPQRKAAAVAAGKGRARSSAIRLPPPSYKEASDSEEEESGRGSSRKGTDSESDVEMQDLLAEAGSDDEEEEGQQAGEGEVSESEALACASCGTESPGDDGWQPHPDTGAPLCHDCMVQQSDGMQGAAEAAGGEQQEAPAAAAAGEEAGEGEGKACCNCGILKPSSWSVNADNGLPECNLCHSFRRKNQGKIRPRSVYQRSKLWREQHGLQPEQQPSRPKPKQGARPARPPLPQVQQQQQGAGAAAAAGSRPAAAPRRPAAGQAPLVCGAAAGARIASLGQLMPVAPRWPLNDAKRRQLNPQAAVELKRRKEAKRAEELLEKASQVKLDMDLAKTIGELVLQLVEEVDTSHADIVVDMQQRLERSELQEQKVQEAYSGLQVEHHAAQSELAAARHGQREAEEESARLRALLQQLQSSQATSGTTLPGAAAAAGAADAAAGAAGTAVAGSWHGGALAAGSSGQGGAGIGPDQQALSPAPPRTTPGLVAGRGAAQLGGSSEVASEPAMASASDELPAGVAPMAAPLPPLLLPQLPAGPGMLPGSVSAAHEAKTGAEFSLGGTEAVVPKAGSGGFALGGLDALAASSEGNGGPDPAAGLPPAEGAMDVDVPEEEQQQGQCGAEQPQGEQQQQQEQEHQREGEVGRGVVASMDDEGTPSSSPGEGTPSGSPGERSAGDRSSGHQTSGSWGAKLFGMFARRPAAQPGSSDGEEEDAAAIGDTSPAQEPHSQQPQQEQEQQQQQRRSEVKDGQRAGRGAGAGQQQAVAEGQGSDESVGQAAVDDLEEGSMDERGGGSLAAALECAMDSQESIAGDPQLAAPTLSGLAAGASSPAAFGSAKPAGSPPLALAAAGKSSSAQLGGSFFTPPPSPASHDSSGRGSQGAETAGREPGRAVATGSVGAATAEAPLATQLMDAAEQLQAVVARAQEEGEEAGAGDPSTDAARALAMDVAAIVASHFD